MTATTVLVAGATGALGSRIGAALLDQPGTSVRLLVRDGWDREPARRARIEPLVAGGATVAVGDVLESSTLPAATEGVDVVVSAVQGRDDVIVDGQVALARAAVAAGARRFIPSDFAVDLFNAPAGAPQFEARKRADRMVEELGIEVVHVLQGAFMDQMLNPAFAGLVDVERGVVRFWGTGDEPFDMTTVEDTARFTALVATDPDAEAGVHTVSGSQVTFTGIAREVERVTGRPMRGESWGDVEALRGAIEAKGGGWDTVVEWYSVAMTSTPPLDHLENERYDGFRPVGLREHVQRAYGPRTAG